MDPNLFADRPAVRPDPAPSDNAVNYLRRLKEQTATDSPSAAADKALPSATGSCPTTGRERRRSPRYKCTGSAELTQEGSQVRLWGTLTDISLRGCYVEMSTTFPVATKVELVLDATEIRVRAHGIVRISYPFLGMGILLTEIAPEHRVLLEKLLATLARATTVANPLARRDETAANAVAAAEPIALLNELHRFFDANPALSREEFRRIARRCQRT